MAQSKPYEQQQVEQLPPLKLTPDNVGYLADLTKRDGSLVEFSPEEIGMIRDQCPEGMRWVDFELFIYRVSTYGINPLMNEAHLEYMPNRGKLKASIQIHVEGYRRMAEATGKVDGFKQIFGEDSGGTFVDTVIWKKGCLQPFEARAYRSEFDTGKGFIWAAKPKHMTAKCSEALCWKRAFPVSGMTTVEEAETFLGDDGGAPPAPAESPYIVAEKQLPDQPPPPGLKAATPAPAPPPVPPMPPPAPTPSAPVADTPAKQYKDTLARIVDMKVGAADVKQFNAVFHAGTKPTPETSIAALLKLERFLELSKKNVDDFVFNPGETAEKLKPAATEAEPVSPGLPADPAIDAALESITKELGWTGELLNIGAWYCADAMIDGAGLKSFLTANKMLDAAPGKIESFLALTRHCRRATDILNFSQGSKTPLGQLENEVGKIVGQPIRYAQDITPGAVDQALDELFERGAIQDTLKERGAIQNAK